MLEPRGLTVGTVGILGLTEFPVNEESYALEEDLLSKIGHMEGMLFQEEGKGWESL
jgi:hypothetical protein